MYYTTSTGYFYSNFPSVSLYRATYTVSLNGQAPDLASYLEPSVSDFNAAFLNITNPAVMGFCFVNCYNYMEHVIYISASYANQIVPYF